MNTSKLARLINVHPDSIRRWATKEYNRFLSPSAVPGKGHQREFNPRDVAILLFVAVERTSGASREDITDRLARFEADGWDGLPDAPSDWFRADVDGTLPVAVAAEQSRVGAELAVLKNENTYLRDALVAAEERETRAQHELERLQASERASISQVHDLELELSQAHGDVEALRARLGAYAITGKEPISLALIVAVASIAGALLVLLSVVVTRLLF